MFQLVPLVASDAINQRWPVFFVGIPQIRPILDAFEISLNEYKASHLHPCNQVTITIAKSSGITLLPALHFTTN